MPILKPKLYNLTSTQKTSIYIETGTYRGDGIKKVLNEYDTIHSIELSEKWYNYNVGLYESHPKVKIHLGDSKKVLPELLASITEPVTIFLDAHYSGYKEQYGEEETPLLFELSILKNRPYDDIIVIDDCRMLGRTGSSGCNNDYYPNMIYDWTDITDEKIQEQLKPGYIILKNTDFGMNYNEFYGYDYGDGWDQYFLVKDKNHN
jgi:hypothetical protein